VRAARACECKTLRAIFCQPAPAAALGLRSPLMQR
jgi:hypothetical protein